MMRRREAEMPTTFTTSSSTAQQSNYTYSTGSSGSYNNNQMPMTSRSTESYGRVPISSSSLDRRQAVADSYSNVIHRHAHHQTNTSYINTNTSNTASSTSIHHQQSISNNNNNNNNNYPIEYAKETNDEQEAIYTYQYNTSTAILLLIPLAAFYYNQCHDDMTSIPSTLVVLLYITLFVYALDLSGNREMTWIGIVVGFIICSMTLLYNGLFTSREQLGPLSSLSSSSSSSIGEEEVNYSWSWRGIIIFMRVLFLSMNILLHFCLACWVTLSFQSLHHEVPLFAKIMEQTLHSLSPIASSFVISMEFMKYITTRINDDNEIFESNMTYMILLLLVPHLWAAWFTLGLVLHGSVPSSYQDDNEDFIHDDDIHPIIQARRSGDDHDLVQEEEEENGHDTSRDYLTLHSNGGISRAIPDHVGRFLSLLLLSIPIFIHLTLCYNGLVSYNAYDVLLVLTVPWLLLDLLNWKGQLWWKRKLPTLLQQSLSHHHHPTPTTTTTTNNRFNPQQSSTIKNVMVSVLLSTTAVMAFLYRHIVPLSISFSYAIHGKDTLAPWKICFFLTTGILFCIMAFWFHGRKSHLNSDGKLFGEYHEDIFQGLCAVGTASIGLAFSLPMNLLPLVILGTLSFGLFIGTKMLRFMAIFLTMMLMTTYILTLHRFHFIKRRIWVLPGIMGVSIHSFSMMIACLGCIGIFVYALVVRSRAGFLDASIKKADLNGVMMVIYSLGLVIIEAAMMHEPIGAVFGGQYDSDEMEDDVETIYAPIISVMTSFLLIIACFWLKRNKAVGSHNIMIVICNSLGKFLAVFLACPDSKDQIHSNDAHTHFLRTTLISSLLIYVICAPYVYLEPNDSTSTHHPIRYRSKGKKISWNFMASQGIHKIIFVYCAIVSPLAIVTSIPMVLKPLVGIIINESTGSYYGVVTLTSEIVGYSFSLWGIVTVSMLAYILPNGGADAWRKLGTSFFFLGVFILLVAPSTPSVREEDVTTLFASISSLGKSLTRTGSKGGWGLISAVLAVLLALTGTLGLEKESRGQKDTDYILRVMIFSIMFGCGISWFIMMQMLHSAPLVAVICIGGSAMIMSFLGTVVMVFGYCWDENDFDFVSKQLKWYLFLCPGLILIMGAFCTFMKIDIPAVGFGGWLSTILCICGMVFLSISLVLRCRKRKNSDTCATGNLCCIISWAIFMVVTYSQYGVESIHTIMGLAPSIFFTLFLSLVLLCLDADQQKRQSRRSLHQRQSKSFGINLPPLNLSERYSICIGAAGITLLVVTLYIMIFSSAHKTYEDVFEVTHGKNSRSNIIKDHHDVATMAMKNFIHSKAVLSAAGLSASGFRTATNYYGPMLHLIGFIATLPCWCSFFLSKMKTSEISSSMFAGYSFLNIFPLFLCKGIPSLHAVACLGLLIGLVQAYNQRKMGRKKHQRI